MYIAMNRFRVAAGREEEFEKVWRERESLLDTVPGFEEFHLLRGASKEGVTPFVSHSRWESEEVFIAWTQSEAFAKAHRSGGMPPGVVMGPPQFEGYTAVAL
jgi:heme-degrading monooxygenase HmoA